MRPRAPLPDLPAPPPGQPDLYYLKLEPGAPPPPDLPADAQRYRLVRDDDYRDWGRIGAGVALGMAVGGIALLWTGVPGWLPGSVFFGSLVVALLAGLAIASVDLPRFIPTADGEYVRAPRSVVAERLGALAGPARLSMLTRVLCGVVGVFFLGLMTSVFVGGLDDIRHVDLAALAGLLIVIGVSAGFCWLAVKGEVPFIGPVDVPASPWFHDLADPSAPLPDDAPISGPRPDRRPVIDPPASRRSVELADPSPTPDER